MDGSTTIATLSLNWGGSGCSALLCVTGPDSVTWSYLGDGNNRVETVNDGTRNLVQISYDNTTNNRPSVLLNADDLARSGSPDPNLNPSYSTSHEIDISYASTGNQVCQISQPHITGADADDDVDLAVQLQRRRLRLAAVELPDQ